MGERAPILRIISSDLARRSTFAQLFRQAGFGVEEAAAAPTGPILADLILLDLSSQLSGLAVCRQFKGDLCTRGIPLLCLATRPLTSTERTCLLENGAHAVVPADAEPAELLALVQAWLRQAGAAVPLRQLAADVQEVVRLEDLAKQKVVYVNPAYTTVWGRPAESLYRQPLDWLQAVHAEDRPRVEAASQAYPTAGAFNLEYRIVCPDGSVRWIWERAFPVRDADGRICHRIRFAEDITQRKKLEEEYRQAQKMEIVGQLAGGIAHDFNNLLTIIQGYGEILLGHVPASHPLRQYLEHIQNAVLRASSLSQQLLTFSRKQEQQAVALDLNALVHDLVRLLRHLVGPAIRIVLQLEPGLALVQAIPGQIDQVLINLIKNARDAMPQGGTLSLTTAAVTIGAGRPELRPGRYAILTVRDTGSGMDEAIQARLFEPFFTTKTQGQRTGLGLFMAATLIRQNQGAIRVTSAPGQGSTFQVYLPLAPATALAATLPPARAAPAGKETVLLVQEDRELQSLVRHLLQLNGYQVLAARHAEEAEAICNQHPGPVHLLLMEETASPLAERLAAQHKGLKVLYLTEDADGPSGVTVPRLQKPFSPGALARRVREVLDQQRAT